MISDHIYDDIPPQMKILNMVIPILMYFCRFVSNCSVASRITLCVIQQNVTLLMTSNKFLTLSNQMLSYKSTCIRMVFFPIILL